MIDFMESNSTSIILLLIGFIFAVPLFLDLISAIVCKFRGDSADE